MKTVILALGLLTSTVAEASEDCESTEYKFRQALSDVEHRLRTYSRCIQDNDGRDDCYSEFRRLQSAQSDLESAVSEYQSECQR